MQLTPGGCVFDGEPVACADRPVRRNAAAWLSSCLALLAAVLTACGASRHAAADGGWFMVEGAPAVVRTLERSGPVPPSGELPLFRPSSLALIGDHLWVGDGGNDRLVELDRDLGWRSVVGRSGAGPGELKVPFAMAAGGGRLAVAELGNGRISVFSDAGAYLESITGVGGVTSLALDRGGAVIVPVEGTDHFLKRFVDGSAEPLAPRPGLADADRSKPGKASTSPAMVATTTGDTLHVLDAGDGILRKYAPDGTFRLARSLPRTLLDSLRTHRERVVKAFGRQGIHVRSAPLVKRLATTTDGDLLILLATGRTFGLLVNPTTYRATRMLVSPDTALARALRSARAAALDGRRLYALVGDSVLAVDLSRQ